LKAGTEGEIDAAFASLVQLQADGLVVGADPFFNSRRDQLASLASRHAVPAIYNLREYATAGDLMSYGTSLGAVYRQVGIYAGWVLKGEKPADLPVPQPTVFASRQSQDRQDARPHRAAIAPRHRRRGDRITR
jgi:putative ABC transport system substrate-binding protein